MQNYDLLELFQNYAENDNAVDSNGELVKYSFRKVSYDNLTAVYASPQNLNPFNDTQMKLVGVITKKTFYSCGYCGCYGMSNLLMKSFENFINSTNRIFNMRIWSEYSKEINEEAEHTITVTDSSESISVKNIKEAIKQYERTQLESDAKEFAFGIYNKTNFKCLSNECSAENLALYIKYEEGETEFVNDYIEKQIEVKANLINYVMITYNMMLKRTEELMTDNDLLKRIKLYSIINSMKGKSFKIGLNVLDNKLRETRIRREELLFSFYSDRLSVNALDVSVRNELKYYYRRNKKRLSTLPLTSISYIKYGKEILYDANSQNTEINS